MQIGTDNQQLIYLLDDTDCNVRQTCKRLRELMATRNVLPKSSDNSSSPFVMKSLSLRTTNSHSPILPFFSIIARVETETSRMWHSTYGVATCDMSIRSDFTVSLFSLPLPGCLSCINILLTETFHANISTNKSHSEIITEHRVRACELMIA